MYIHIIDSLIFLYFNIEYFLAIDGRMVGEVGDMLFSMVTHPHTNKSTTITLAPGVFEMIEEGSPITIDNIVLRRRRPPRARKDEARAVAEAATTN
jgi:hypothetical protein